ncbi:MAG: hypothetical protein ACNS62_15870 [Candidatus Cyclobacteriaceae bacterium M3_2C_046]
MNLSFSYCLQGNGSKIRASETWHSRFTRHSQENEQHYFGGLLTAGDTMLLSFSKQLKHQKPQMIESAVFENEEGIKFQKYILKRGNKYLYRLVFEDKKADNLVILDELYDQDGQARASWQNDENADIITKCQ